MKIRTYKELHSWLADNSLFEDVYVLRIDTNPLRIVVGYNIVGNYEANSRRTIRSFTLQPDKVKEWTWLSADFIPSDDNCIEGIDPIDASPDIGLEFIAYTPFKLVTDGFTITENENITTTFRPWVNDKEVFVTSSLTDIPRPDYWRNKLKERGHDVGFRFYCGEEKPLENLPYPDYSGYYIQKRDLIASTNEGIFIEHIRTNGKAISFHFRNKDVDLESIWVDLNVVVSEMPNVVINSGNSKFTGEEWRQHLSKLRV